MGTQLREVRLGTFSCQGIAPNIGSLWVFCSYLFFMPNAFILPSCLSLVLKPGVQHPQLHHYLHAGFQEQLHPQLPERLSHRAAHGHPGQHHQRSGQGRAERSGNKKPCHVPGQGNCKRLRLRGHQLDGVYCLQWIQERTKGQRSQLQAPASLVEGISRSSFWERPWA